MSNELRRSVMLRGVLGPKGKPGASAINDGVLSGHFDSLATQVGRHSSARVRVSGSAVAETSAYRHTNPPCLLASVPDLVPNISRT